MDGNLLKENIPQIPPTKKIHPMSLFQQPLQRMVRGHNCWGVIVPCWNAPQGNVASDASFVVISTPASVNSVLCTLPAGQHHQWSRRGETRSNDGQHMVMTTHGAGSSSCTCGLANKNLCLCFHSFLPPPLVHLLATQNSFLRKLPGNLLPFFHPSARSVPVPGGTGTWQPIG